MQTIYVIWLLAIFLFIPQSVAAQTVTPTISLFPSAISSASSQASSSGVASHAMPTVAPTTTPTKIPIVKRTPMIMPLSSFFNNTPQPYQYSSQTQITQSAAAIIAITAVVFILFGCKSMMLSAPTVKRYMGIFLLFLGMGMLAGLWYIVTTGQKKTVYSSYVLLKSSWNNYKLRFITADGRVVDPSQGNIITSEGQGYAMLQAVWVDDKQTFDSVWQWTKTHLKRPRDHLFAWRYGKLSSGRDGFLPGGGNNAASDADTDIALALVLASRRWVDTSYASAATPIIADVWNIETVQLHGTRYLIAGNWANESSDIIINPSYFSPYAWRLFAAIDAKHSWNSLITPAYTLLTLLGKAPLDTPRAVGLPPDWVAISKKTYILEPTHITRQTTNYSFDAMRIPWQIAIDYEWNKDLQAKQYLSSLGYLNEYYTKHKTLALSYHHDGTPLSSSENPAMYATSLSYFMIEHPAQAQEIYQDKILSMYSNDMNAFQQNIPYFEANWLWFGAALYNHDISVF